MSAEVENKTLGRLLMGGQEYHAFALLFIMHSQCLYGWERMEGDRLVLMARPLRGSQL